MNKIEFNSALKSVAIKPQPTFPAKPDGYIWKDQYHYSQITTSKPTNRESKAFFYAPLTIVRSLKHPLPWRVLEVETGKHRLEDADGFLIGLIADMETGCYIVEMANLVC